MSQVTHAELYAVLRGSCSCATSHLWMSNVTRVNGAGDSLIIHGKGCVAVCCSALQYVAVCCSVLQCVGDSLLSDGTADTYE